MTAVQPSSSSPTLEAGHRHAWQMLRAGQLEAAEKAFRSLLQDDPGSADVWAGIGLVAYRARRFEDAERALRKALFFDPEAATTKHHLAVVLRALGKLDAALELFAQLSESFAANDHFLNNWGNALVAAKRAAEGADVLRRALALRPESDLYRLNLGRALIACERADEALAVVAAAPGGGNAPKFAGLVGSAHLILGDNEAAAAALRRLCDAGLADGEDLHNLATALQNLGRMEEAEGAYRQAIAKKPDMALSRRQLAGIVKFGGTEQELNELRAALEQPDLGASDRAEIHLGLAKALDDVGAYAEAFANLQAGNQLIRMSLKYSPNNNTAFVDRSIETFDAAFLDERGGWGSRSTRPIFILGMPRSGTTLTEQILCSHPKVHGAGELLTIFRLFLELRTTLKPDLGLPRIASLLTPETALGMAESYLETLRKLNADSPFVSDKMPFNYRYLGLISLLFPDAKIIHTVRHPLDTGLSCYFARFRDQLDFSFNLSDIGRYYRDYARLMEHWAKVIRNDLLVIDYDTLVANQERETRRLLEFCGLDWDDRCLDFHHTERQVLTASNWQVRQPLYSSSSGRWRHYRKWLGPMIASLGLGDPENWKPREDAVGVADAILGGSRA